MRVMTTHGALLVTPRLELAARIAGLRIGLTARYGYSSDDDVLGTARAHLFTGGIAVTDRVFKRGVFGLGTGPRVELGGIAGQGDGANGTSTTAFTIAGSWAVELRAELAPVTVFVAGDVGVSRGLVLRADQRDVLHLSGPFVGAALGLTF